MNVDGIGVYRISSPNGSAYIGMTAKSFKERWKGHLKSFRLGSMKCPGLKRAFEKYGPDKMTFEVLEDMTGHGEVEILRREKIWWLRHKSWGINLYNGEPSGNGSVLHTEETRRRIGLSMREFSILNRKFSQFEDNCKTCKKSFLKLREKHIFCSIACASNDSETNGSKISKISKETLIDAVVKGGNSYIIAETLGIKKSSLYNLLHKYDLTIKSLQGKSPE